MDPIRLVVNVRATGSGTYPNSAAMAMIREYVSLEIFEGLLNAKDTVVLETPALSAMSRIVALIWYPMNRC